VGAAGSCSFPTDSCKFPTEEIWVLKGFNFAPKFVQNGGFSAARFALFDENFPRRKFSDRLKFGKGEQLPHK